MTENQAKFRKLPYWVRENIFREETMDANDKILATFELDDNKKKVLFELLRDIILKNIRLEQFYQKLKSANLVNPDQLTNLAIEVAKARFLPIEKWLGITVDNYIQNWEKENFSYQEEPKVYLEETEKEVAEGEEIQTQTVTSSHKLQATQASQAVTTTATTDLNQITTEIVKLSRIDLEDPILSKRFKSLALSYLKQYRSLTQVQESLERPKKIGGLELSKNQIPPIIKLLKIERKKLEESRKIKGEKPASEIGKLIASNTVPVYSLEKSNEERRPSTSSSPQGSSFDPEFKTEGRLSRAGSIEKEQREKRDDLPTPRGATVGKHKVMAEKEMKKNPQNQNNPQNYLDNILQGYSLEQETRNNPPMGDLQQREKQETRDADTMNIQEIAPELPISAQPPALSKVEGSSRPAAQPPSRPAVAPVKIQEIRPPFAKASGGVSPQFNKSNKPINAINTPVASKQNFKLRTATAVANKRLESISQTPELTGEVEEIGSLKLADFRRWSTEPQESAARVKEKIESIEKESLEKKAQAIHAWKNSEINKLYIDMGQSSMLQGQSIEEIIKIRQAENKPNLSLAEFEAIADLNRELNF